MRLSILSQLAYRFEQPSEVLLLIEAARTPDQGVAWDQLTISPHGIITRLDDPVSGERHAVILAEGEVDIRYDAWVDVARPPARLQGLPATPIHALPLEALRYLRPSRYCPSDRFEAFVHRTFGRLSGGDKVAAMVDWLGANLTYEPGASGSGTDAVATFIDRAGVCRDFAHLAISFCRAADIPARAVSAYAWGLDPPDLHAVVEVWLGGAWRLVDPTGLAPVEGLVRVATGADASDIAFMTIFGRAEMLAQSFSVQEMVEAAV